MKPRHPITALLILLAASGAGAGEPDIYKGYDGPDLPADQQVVLKVPQVYPGFHLIKKPEVGIFAFDGKRITSGLSLARHDREYLFLPGRHVIAFRITRGDMSGDVIRQFVGVAGKTYSTRLDSSVFTFHLSIVDDSTGQPVDAVQGAKEVPRAQPPTSNPPIP